MAERTMWTRKYYESVALLEISRNKIYEKINIISPKIFLLNKQTSLLLFLKKRGGGGI